MFKDSYDIKNDNNYWYLNIFSYICIQKSETSTGLQPTLTIFISEQYLHLIIRQSFK